MIQKYVIGIDVSKSKLDCAIMDFNLLLFDEKSIANNQKSIGSFISTLIKKLPLIRTSWLFVVRIPEFITDP
jgi:predicted NBD/HSP70 family sugar kinase